MWRYRCGAQSRFFVVDATNSDVGQRNAGVQECVRAAEAEAKLDPHTVSFASFASFASQPRHLGDLGRTTLQALLKWQLVVVCSSLAPPSGAFVWWTSNGAINTCGEARLLELRLTFFWYQTSRKRRILKLEVQTGEKIELENNCKIGGG